MGLWLGGTVEQLMQYVPRQARVGEILETITMYV